MALYDYKFDRISEADSRVKVSCSFYEGDVTTEDEQVEGGAIEPVTRYRRTALIEQRSFDLHGTVDDLDEDGHVTITEYINGILLVYGQPIDQQTNA